MEQALVLTLLNYGTTPALVVLAALVGVLIKKLDENAKKDEKRDTAFQEALSNTSKEFRKALTDHATATEERFQEHSDRMSCIERDYLTREMHYRDIGGWRTEQDQTRAEIRDEFRAVRGEINALNTNLIGTILKGAQNGA